MRTKIIIVLALFVLAILNYGIYEKEQIKKKGEIVLLKLAPVDPRSLMQGDYMRLRYTLESEILSQAGGNHQKRGYVVVRPDKNNVAQFVRIYQNEKLVAGEKLFRYYNQTYSIRIVPDSFLFQEGQAQLYQEAKYGIFKFSGQKDYLLVGLANADREEIGPPGH